MKLSIIFFFRPPRPAKALSHAPAGHACWLALAALLAVASAGPAAAREPVARSAEGRPLIAEVVNATAMRRDAEVLVLKLGDVRRRRPSWRPDTLVARLAGEPGTLPTQLFASDGGATPDTLLVQLDLPPRSSVRLAIAPAAGSPAPAVRRLYARHVPERDDDFAWENLQVAYRIYGPGLQAKGEVSSGIDVWSKRPPHLVIDDWYRRDAQALRQHDPALSYHVDNGVGLDSYAVGHTPGAGGTAAWIDGQPEYSKNPTRVRITAMGPVRLRFEVDYAPWRAGSALIREHKVVTLDAGSHMNRQWASYRIEGAERLTVAAGVSVHADAQVEHDGAAGIAVWDTPQKAGAGRIGTALVVPPQERARYVRGKDAAWALFDIHDGSVIRFASGAAWSKGDMPDFRAWRRYVRDDAFLWSHPLRVRWLDR